MEIPGASVPGIVAFSAHLSGHSISMLPRRVLGFVASATVVALSAVGGYVAVAELTEPEPVRGRTSRPAAAVTGSTTSTSTTVPPVPTSIVYVERVVEVPVERVVEVPAPMPESGEQHDKADPREKGEGKGKDRGKGKQSGRHDD